jgi:uncharacterized protein YaaQ
MKLVTAIVQDEDAGKLVNALVKAGFRATRFQSHGGFLRARNSTILLGVEDTRLDAALRIIRENCRTRARSISPLPSVMEPGEFFMPQPVEVQVGGATVFVTNVEHYERV